MPTALILALTLHSGVKWRGNASSVHFTVGNIEEVMASASRLPMQTKVNVFLNGSILRQARLIIPAQQRRTHVGRGRSLRPQQLVGWVRRCRGVIDGLILFKPLKPGKKHVSLLTYCQRSPTFKIGGPGTLLYTINVPGLFSLHADSGTQDLWPHVRSKGRDPYRMQCLQRSAGSNRLWARAIHVSPWVPHAMFQN